MTIPLKCCSYPISFFTGIVIKSQNLGLFGVAMNQFSFRDIVNFNYDEVYEKFDNITFGECNEYNNS